MSYESFMKFLAQLNYAADLLFILSIMAGVILIIDAIRRIRARKPKNKISPIWITEIVVALIINTPLLITLFFV